MISLKSSKKYSQLLLISILFLSIFIRLFFIHPTFSDETFYFNAAKQILNGYIPYKDFFFSHPPLQIYAIAFLYKIFGISFFIGKLLTLITSTLSALLIYLILKELYDIRAGFLASIIFLLNPVFISFSTMGYGMWETLIFILLSLYLIIKNKLNLAGIAFTTAILFRYLAILYLPTLIILTYFRKQNFKIFLLWFLITFFISFSLLFIIFKSPYIEQTVSYQIISKITMETSGVQMQYWSIGYFFLFLSLISLIVSLKDKTLLVFSLTVIITDMIILLSLKLFFYHYFLISLAFCIMVIGRVLITSKDWIIKIIFSLILLLAIINNAPTIDFYLNPSYAERYYSISSFIENRTSINDSIFGEPVITNFISFSTNRRISSNYLDSYLRHLVFEGEDKVIENLEKNKPKIFIEMENYYLSDFYFRDFILNNYEFERKFEGMPSYSIYRLKT